MPKAVKKDVAETTETPKKVSINKFFSNLDKMNPYGCQLNNNTLSLPKEWVSTGSYALNAILSGSLFKGIPVGRIAGFDGDSGGGKSLFTQKIGGIAQKMGYYPIIWDSEFAIDGQVSEGLGIDPKNARWYPAENIESTRNQISAFLDDVIELNKTNPNPQKFIIIVDSIANLASIKELEDAKKGKDASDVGQRAKALKSFFRVLTYKVGIAQCGFLFTNHVYEGMEPYPVAFKKSSGGKGPIYMSSIVCQTSPKKERNADELGEALSDLSKYSGVTLSVTTTKNRFIPQYLKTSLYLNFKTGLDKYAGLLDISEDVGLITKEGRKYVMNGESIGFRGNFEADPKFWDPILPQLEKLVSSKYRYSQEELEKNLKEQEEEIEAE